MKSTQMLKVEVTDTVISPKAQEHTISEPTITGVLPNTYSESSTVTVVVNGVTYTPQINNGHWSVEINPPLPQGVYDVTLDVDNEAIVYPNYVDIHGYQASKKKIMLSNIPLIETIDVTTGTSEPNRRQIVKTDVKNYSQSDFLQFADVKLARAFGKDILKNPSFSVIGSLLAEYKDSSGNKVLVNLKFDKPIPAMTNVELINVAHADKM